MIWRLRSFSLIFTQDIFPIKNYPFCALNEPLFHHFYTFLVVLAPPLPCALGHSLVGLMVAPVAGASRSMADYVHLLVQLFLFWVTSSCSLVSASLLLACDSVLTESFRDSQYSKVDSIGRL